MEKEKIKEPIETRRYSINENHYTYQIFQEDNDKIPLSVIDYKNKETIIKSIEKYYKTNGGMHS